MARLVKRFGHAVVDPYRALLATRRRRAVWFIALVAVSTLMEGLAVATLVPLLSHAAHYELLGHTYSGSTVRTVALIGFVVVGLAAAFTKFLAETTALRFLADVEQELRESITELLLRMSWSSFLSLRLGDINASTLLAANQIAIGAHFFLRAIGAVLATGILATISFVISPVLSAFVVAFGIVAALMYRVGVRRAELHARELTTHADSVGSTVTDVFANLKFFQSTGNVEQSQEQTFTTYREYASSWFQSQRYTPLVRVWFESGAIVLIGAVLALALLADGELTPTAIASLAIFSRLVPRITLAQEWFQAARVRVPWITAWQERTDVAREAARPHVAGAAPTFEHALAAVDVGFGYPDTDHDVLSGVSWTLRRGETLALVGESGSGKTTMLDLATGLLTPTSGTLTVDGAPLPDLDLHVWQRRIGLVMQNSPLFHTSVIENVRWTEPELDLDRVMECLELANARRFVDDMPDGANTVIGEAGGKLSGGQRQRLALARALYRRPWLLVLDEPTSALDAESEELMLRALESVRGTCSILIAAHRLRTIRDADEILVFSEGRVVERGGYDALADNASGVFARVLAGDGPPSAPA